MAQGCSITVGSYHCDDASEATEIGGVSGYGTGTTGGTSSRGDTFRARVKMEQWPTNCRIGSGDFTMTP